MINNRLVFIKIEFSKCLHLCIGLLIGERETIPKCFQDIWMDQYLNKSSLYEVSMITDQNSVKI